MHPFSGAASHHVVAVYRHKYAFLTGQIRFLSVLETRGGRITAGIKRRRRRSSVYRVAVREVPAGASQSEGGPQANRILLHFLFLGFVLFFSRRFFRGGEYRSNGPGSLRPPEAPAHNCGLQRARPTAVTPPQSSCPPKGIFFFFFQNILVALTDHPFLLYLFVLYCCLNLSNVIPRVEKKEKNQ